jgi:nitrogen fixation protein FixH
MKQIKGWHVFAAFAFGFGTIIAVNLTLAVNAVRSFPGLEVKNSYVASQGFQAQRRAQEALGWDVTATLQGDQLSLRFDQDGRAVAPRIESAVFGRATSVAVDQTPDFRYGDGQFTAHVTAGPGNWNLRIVAIADDGTRFQQRIVIEVLG